MTTRRDFLATVFAAPAAFAKPAGKKILLRSSWQTVNIGDIAHTPGMLALIETHRPDDAVTLWPGPLSVDVEALLLKRFPKLSIAKTKDRQDAALAACDFFLHGSGPGLVGIKEVQRAKDAFKPYGFAGVTLTDAEIKTHKALLTSAKFVFCRDTDSLDALNTAILHGPNCDFGPDATFALDLTDAAAADKLLNQHGLEPGRFLCAVPRLRWTPYWEIKPETTKPNPERSAVNEAFAERDHAKMREGIVAWVRGTKGKAFLVPEMTYAVPRLKPLLYDPLPDDVKKRTVVLDRYWLTAEAAGVYAKAGMVLSCEMHSPIMAVANGTPAVLLRQPTDTRKGQMWRDVGLKEWILEIDATTGADVAKVVTAIANDLPAAKAKAKTAHEFAKAKMKAMMLAID